MGYKYCVFCGKQIPDDYVFCSYCGKKVVSAGRPNQNGSPAAPPSPQGGGTKTFTPPPQQPNPVNVAGGTKSFTPPGGNQPPRFTPPGGGQPPRFTPPGGGNPTRFTPPTGPTCYYHQDEPAVTQCARCGRNLCEDCFDSYGVAEGEYKGKALCYDCTKEIVAENVEVLKGNKKAIMTTFILTLVGMVVGGIIGGAIGSSGHATGWGIFLGAMIGGCLWTFFKNWMARIGGALKGGGFNLVSFFVGLIVGLVIEAVLSIYRTIRKVIECIIYLKRTSGFIESDSEALNQMTEYMEYTMVRNQNRGVDIETLLKENSQLADNSIAQMARTKSEEEIEAQMRGCLATINENGEIIRSFAA